MKFERCPIYCLRDPEEFPQGCQGCGHLEDVKVDPPIPVVSKIKPFRPGKIVGINNNKYYVEEKMTNGGTTVYSVDRDSVKKI